MNLVAALVIRNELGRYLAPCIEHLLAFCDTVVVLDDASDDGTREFLVDYPSDRVAVALQRESTFYRHEGRTRQRLLDATLALSPSHVLSIDADELVDDGQALRALLEASPSQSVFPLLIEEVWKADGRILEVREDGGWRSHPVPFLWRVDPVLRYRMMDRKLACRRVPTQVLRTPANAEISGSLLHFGWTDEQERAARYARYVEHDGGQFHQRAHLNSIMWPDGRVTLRERPWPVGAVFEGLRDRFAKVTA